MSSKESDSAKWVLVLKATEHDEPSDVSVSTPTNEKRKSLLSSLDSADNMSISTPIAHDTMDFSVGSYSQCDAMSISNSTHDLNTEQSQQPDNNELPSTLTSNTSFSKYFNMDEGWSFSMPDVSPSPLNEEPKEPVQPESTPSSPVPFQSMSIESIYSIWTHGNMSVVDTLDEEERPPKRLKSVDSHTATSQLGIFFCRLLSFFLKKKERILNIPSRSIARYISRCASKNNLSSKNIIKTATKNIMQKGK